jgi:hypothetical protein
MYNFLPLHFSGHSVFVQPTMFSSSQIFIFSGIFPKFSGLDSLFGGCILKLE